MTVLRMRLLRLSLAALILVPATAQAQSRPLINQTPIPMQFQQLNIDEVDANAPIELAWTADVPLLQSYRYELTYDNPRSDENPNVELVVLDDTQDAGENTGVVVSGQRYVFRIRPQQIILMPGTANPESEFPENAPVDTDDQPQQRSIILQVFVPGQAGDDLSAQSVAWTFDYDTRRPPAPTVTSVLPGENRVVVSWRPPEQPADIEMYEVVYCPEAFDVQTTTTSTSGDDIAGLPCELDDAIKATAGMTLTTLSIDDGIQNGIPVAVAVRSVDEFGNRGDVSNAKVQTPAETTDFWELYKGTGGQEDGGFCFVATAAHGSYAHPVVRVLRAFRDRVLKSSYVGTGLVWAYYHLSPPAAEVIRQDPALAGWARAALVPVTLFAVLWMILPLAGGGLLLLLFGRRLLGRFSRRAGAGAAVLALVLVPVSAEADELYRAEPEGLLGFGFEFKGGPYLPDMGTATGGTEGNTAFARIFDTDPNALYQLGLDIQIYRGIGTAGVGGTFGFMQFVGKGVFGVSQNKSLDTTVFNIVPLTLEAFYRFDWLADRIPVPLVPYVRGGLAYHFWWITTGTGDVARFEGSDADNPDDDVAGRGGKIGVTGTVGVALMLNHFEPAAARSLYNTTGIRGVYVFGELQASKVDGFGSAGFDLSEVTWNVGMYLEL